MKPEITEEIITPTKAKEYLAAMAPNRQVRQNRVKMMVDDMVNGSWTECLNPISFDEDGFLIDGQHRLLAIVKSDIAQRMLVARGVPRNIVFDKGAARSTVDSINIRGLVGSGRVTSDLVAIVRKYHEVISGSKARHLTETQIASFFMEYEEEIRLVQKISNYKGNHAVGDVAGVKVALFAAMLCGVNEGVLFDFMFCVNTGDCPRGLADSAAIRLRDYIQQEVHRRSSDIKSVRKLESITEQALHDYIAGKQRSKKYQKYDIHFYIELETEAAEA